MKNKKGFTLIELMIVVAIIGILAALAIPDFMKMLAKSKQSEAKTNLGAIFTGQVAYFGEQNEYGNTFPLIAWYPEGQNLYAYGMGAATTSTLEDPAQDLILNLKGDTDAPCNAIGTPPPATTPGTFTVVATGNVDNDLLCDYWWINEQKMLTNETNDVNLK